MKAHDFRKSFCGKVGLPREKSHAKGNMLQMKHCNDNIVERMAGTSLFANLPEEERRSLADVLKVRIRSYERGEMIINECDPTRDVYIVLKGRISVSVCGVTSDRRHLVYWLGPGSSYGTTFPGLEVKRSPCMLIASSPTEVMLCRVAKIRDVIRHGMHIGFIANLYKATVSQGYTICRKLSLLSCYQTADRVRLYLRFRHEEGLSASTLPPLAEIAEYLGVNRTSLYRAMRKMGKEITAET